MNEETYLDLGYDNFLMRSPIQPVQQSANEFDSVYEVSEGAIGGAAIKQDAITSDKIEYLEVKGWTMTMAFSATNYRIVAWSSGTITLKDGTTFTIDAGNTGAMTAGQVYYIYFDKDTSQTVLQVTTDPDTQNGGNKIKLGVAQAVSDVTKLATFQAFGGKGGVGILIVTDNLAANAVTANELAANSVYTNALQALAVVTGKLAAGAVTADKITVSQLSAISADIGTVTAGTIIGNLIETAIPSASSGSGVVIEGGADKLIKFYYNTTNVAYIRGLNTLDDDGEIETLRIQNDVGCGLRFRQSNIGCSTNFIPTGTTETKDLGTGGSKWRDVYADAVKINTLYIGAGAGEEGQSFECDTADGKHLRFVKGACVAVT